MKTSPTALVQYEHCPHQYYEERIAKKYGQPPDSFRLGRVCHRTIKRLMEKHRQDGVVKDFDASLAHDYYQEEWSAETGLSGADLFTEGLGMVIGFVERWSPMDPKRILGIEEAFEIAVTVRDEDADDESLDDLVAYHDAEDNDHVWECPKHGFQPTPHCPECHAERADQTTIVRGFMDLVFGDDTIDEETGEVTRVIEVIDYKSTHAFLTSRDAEASIQLAIYNLAAREKWSGAQKYLCSLHMLRDGVNITVRHEPAQLEGFKRYIIATANQIERDTSWVTKLGPDCCFCHLRGECVAYQKALKTHSHLATESLADLNNLAKEREEVAIHAKIFKKRLDEIDDVLEAHLDQMQGPLFLNGYVFSKSVVKSLQHEPATVIELLSTRLGLSAEEIIKATMEVQKKRLDQLLTEQSEKHGLTKIGLVKAALVNRAGTKVTTRMNPPRKEKETHKKKE
jgi:hypothetical protein